MNRFPPGWITADEKYEDDGDIIEYVPQGQTAENWSEMLTFQTFKKAANADPAGYLSNMAALAKLHCASSNLLLKDSVKDTNGLRTEIGLLGCAKDSKTGEDETTLFKVISGHQALYVGQMAKRSDPAAPANQPSDAEIQDWETLLDSFKICRGTKC
ncbi:MAG TPA: hypothetical protein VGM16_12745 [Gammaproteobacteria bacterium]